jgi:hypothetical protein
MAALANELLRGKPRFLFFLLRKRGVYHPAKADEENR